MIKLETPKQVMQALIDGHKIIHSGYGWNNDTSKACGEYLFMSDHGDICEEDGAGAKQDRFPICMRGDEEWFLISEKDLDNN